MSYSSFVVTDTGGRFVASDAHRFVGSTGLQRRDPAIPDFIPIPGVTNVQREFDVFAEISQTVPEPGTGTLVGLGVAGLTWRVRRMKRS